MFLPGPDLASVIGADPEEFSQWESMKLRADCPLSRLHAKFWGKDVAKDK
jgi:hypothetical protein